MDTVLVMNKYVLKQGCYYYCELPGSKTCAYGCFQQREAFKFEDKEFAGKVAVLWMAAIREAYGEQIASEKIRVVKLVKKVNEISEPHQIHYYIALQRHPVDKETVDYLEDTYTDGTFDKNKARRYATLAEAELEAKVWQAGIHERWAGHTDNDEPVEFELVKQ